MTTVDINKLGPALGVLMEAARNAPQFKLDVQYKTPWTKANPRGPYPYQVEFHNAGRDHRERALLAANRIGKSFCGGAEMAIHLTGRYPDWWKGHRFTRPIQALVCGLTNQSVRDINQFSLFGTIQEDRMCSGTGWVPKELIDKPRFRQCGVSDVIDYVRVRHVNGGWSYCYFQSYEQGAGKFAGYERDAVWCDEEPENDDDIFPAIQTRLLSKRGHLIFTRTPELGFTPMVEYFWKGSAGSYCKNVGMADAPHFTEEEVAQIKRQLEISAPHLVQPKIYGVPALGEGGVFSSVPDTQITCERFQIPAHFRRIVGIDFGIDHPASAVWLAHDADRDILYVYDCYRESGKIASYHAQSIKARGGWIPVAWPHDGLNRDKGSGKALKDLYEQHGLNMLSISARYDDKKGGGQSTETVVADVLERMHTSRFKVFSDLTQWFEEKRMYHRKNGVIVKQRDDLLSGTFYGTMMLRYARSGADEELSKRLQQQGGGYRQPEYDPLARI